jgi:alkylation response protein AidB-like acyl-CoA dehydrogenase
MVELYWPALAIAEDRGGLGMGFVEVALVAEELGRAVVPGPFLATVTQFAPAVRELGGDAPLAADLLGRIAAGELTGSVALAERGRWEPAAVAATAEETAGGWALRGSKDAVLDGADAEEVLVVARTAGTSGTDGLGAFVVAVSSAHVPSWARRWTRRMFDAGWLVPGWPPERGGRKAGPVRTLVYLEELARAGIPRTTNPQGLGIVVPSILDYGTDDQVRDYAMPVLRGEKAACLPR